VLEYGVEVSRLDGNGWSAMHAAVRKGHTDVLRVLLQSDGVQPDVRCRDGWTPLQVAVCRVRQSATLYLLTCSLFCNCLISAESHQSYLPEFLTLISAYRTPCVRAQGVISKNKLKVSI
jgi:hypothetical protein